MNIKTKVEDMLRDFRGVKGVRGFKTWDIYNDCYDMFDLYIYIEDIPVFLEMLNRYELEEFVEYMGTNGGQDMISSRSYEYIAKREERCSIRFWIHVKSKSRLGILDTAMIRGKHDEFMDLKARYGITRNHAIWFRWTSNRHTLKEDIEVLDDRIIFRSRPYVGGHEWSRWINKVCINGKWVFVATQSGSMRNDFTSLQNVVSVLMRDGCSLSKVYKAYAYAESKTTSNFVFVNDGTFDESEFKEYLEKNNRLNEIKPRRKSKTDMSEKELIKKEIRRLQKKLRELS